MTLEWNSETLVSSRRTAPRLAGKSNAVTEFSSYRRLALAGTLRLVSRNPRHFCELRYIMRARRSRLRPSPIPLPPTLIPRVHSGNRNSSRRLHRTRPVFPAPVPPSTRLQSRLLVIFLSASRRRGIFLAGEFECFSL